jgi:hypothetical protein
MCAVAVLSTMGAVIYGLSASADSVSTAHAVHAKVAPCRGHHTCTPTPTPTPTPTASSSTSTSAPPPGGHKVIVIVEENHSRVEAMAGMSHLAGWASQYGQATN